MTESYTSFMMDHAAGNHGGALELAGDMHMLLNPVGAETAWLWSVVGGAILEQQPEPAQVIASQVQQGC